MDSVIVTANGLRLRGFGNNGKRMTGKRMARREAGFSREDSTQTRLGSFGKVCGDFGNPLEPQRHSAAEPQPNRVFGICPEAHCRHPPPCLPQNWRSLCRPAGCRDDNDEAPLEGVANFGNVSKVLGMRTKGTKGTRDSVEVGTGASLSEGAMGFWEFRPMFRWFWQTNGRAGEWERSVGGIASG
jgi:hypothetical protein